MWRRKCRQSFEAFCIEALAPFNLTPAAHHRLLIKELEAVAAAITDRLMIFMPPGSAKSTYVSKLFPAWLMTAGGIAVIGASHTSTLAQEFSGDVRRFINQTSETTGYGLATDRADRWRTTNGCEYLAAGVNTGIAGFRSDVAIIDDPVKSRQDADSEAFRERTWKWFQADLGARMKPGGRIILMHTRWHEDDLAGRLLQTQSDKWRVLKLPALATDGNDPLRRQIGEPLWGDDSYGYGAELVEKRDSFERDGAAREWASLYQQNPRPTDGALFKPTNIPAALDAAPLVVQQVRAWDLAATAQTGTRDPDWTVGLRLGRMANGQYVVMDIVRVRGGPADIEQLITNTASRDGKSVPISLPQDPGQAGKSQVRYLAGMLSGYTVHVSPETGDKATRASPVASQCNVGNLLMVQANWNASFIDEIGGFPSASKDDQVDALSRAFAHVALTQKVPIVGAIVAMTPRAMTP